MRFGARDRIGDDGTPKLWPPLHPSSETEYQEGPQWHLHGFRDNKKLKEAGCLSARCRG